MVTLSASRLKTFGEREDSVRVKAAATSSAGRVTVTVRRSPTVGETGLGEKTSDGSVTTTVQLVAYEPTVACRTPVPFAKPVTVTPALALPAEIVMLAGVLPNKAGERDDRATTRLAPDCPAGRITVSVLALPTLLVSGLGRNVSGGLLTTTARFVVYVPTLACSEPDPLAKPVTITSALTDPAGMTTEPTFTLNTPGASDKSVTVRLLPDSESERRTVTVRASPTAFVRGSGRKLSVGSFTMTFRFVVYVPTRASRKPDPPVRPNTVTVALMPPTGIRTLPAPRENTAGDREESSSESAAPASVDERLIRTVLASPTVFVRGTGMKLMVGLLTVTDRFVL